MHCNKDKPQLLFWISKAFIEHVSPAKHFYFKKCDHHLKTDRETKDSWTTNKVILMCPYDSHKNRLTVGRTD